MLGSAWLLPPTPQVERGKGFDSAGGRSQHSGNPGGEKFDERTDAELG